jgi:hypothetical protein
MFRFAPILLTAALLVAVVVVEEPTAPPEATRSPSMWMEAVQAQLEADVDTPEARVIRHPGSGLRAYVAAEGATLVDAGDQAIAVLRTARVYQGEEGEPLGAGGAPALVPCYAEGCARRVEVAHEGVTTWWERRAPVVEQGWTVQAPLGVGDLHIELAVDGADVRTEGGLIRVGEPGQGVVGSGVVAWDAVGRPLSVSLEALDGVVDLAVDVEGAVWPVTVDPLWEPWDWQKAGAGDSAGFGAAVALDADVNGDGYADALVGSPGFDGAGANVGRVYLYLGGPQGLATRAAMTWTGTQAGGSFGATVAFVGDVNGDGYEEVAVGADGFDAGGLADRGAVFLYLGSAQGPGSRPIVRLLGPKRREHFGGALAAAGDVNGDGYADLLVGRNWQGDAGGVHLFLGGANGPSASPDRTWPQAQRWEGHVVAGLGDLNGDGLSDVAIGSGRRNHHTPRLEIYLGRPTGPRANPDQTLFSYDGAGVTSADVDQDGLADLITARRDRIELRYGSAGGLPVQADQSVPLPEGQDDVWLSALGDMTGDGLPDIIASLDGRSARLFRTDGTGLDPQWRRVWNNIAITNMTPGHMPVTMGDANGDGLADALLGLDDGHSAVFDEPVVSHARGATLLLEGEVGGPPAPEPGFSSDIDAYEVLYADLDQDGDVDMLRPERSALQWTPATPAGFDDSQTVQLTPAPGWTWPGSYRRHERVACLTDFTGDGAVDLVLLRAGQAQPVELIEGGPFGPTGAPVTLSIGFDTTSELVCAGDLNGDGTGDLTLYRSGVFDVWFGGPVPVAGGTRISGRPHLGIDINGDGRNELISNGLELRFGRPTGPSQAADQRFSLPAGSTQEQIADAGDLDGDGFRDLVLTATRSNQGQDGQIHYLRGSAAGLVTVPAATWSAWYDQTDLATARLTGLGDVDGDGFDDLGVAVEPLYDETRLATPFLHVLRGGAGGPGAAPWWEGPAGLRVEVLPALGDLDGDGRGDSFLLEDQPWWDGRYGGHNLFGGPTGMTTR